MKYSPLSRHIGKFTVGLDDIKALPDWVRQLMSTVIVVRANFAFDQDGIEYMAISADFAAVPEDQEAPRYVIRIENGNFGGWA